MASKLNNNMNKAVMFHALLGLLVGVIARTCFHGLHQNVVENQGEISYFGQQFGEFNVEILFILIKKGQKVQI